MSRLGRFTKEGIEEFRKLLDSIRKGQIQSLPEGFVDEPRFRQQVGQVEIEKQVFESKIEMIRHIHDEVLQGLRITDCLYDIDLCSWLAAFYFDSICPMKNGNRNVGDDVRYILMSPRVYNRYYRHLIASPLRIYHDLGDISTFLLNGAPHVRGDFYEQITSRQKVISSPGVVEAIRILYWDNAKDGPKKKALNKDGDGVLRRLLVSAIPQFNRTYDLFSMNQDDIIGLLPEEYNIWRENRD
jgi:hypothetical protein